MQSPEDIKSSKIRISTGNSKLHTPCRQIGLRRKRPANVKKIGYSPIISNNVVSADENMTNENCISPSEDQHVIIVDENQTKENHRSPVEDGYTMGINENETNERCSSPVEKAKPVIIVDENQTKENHRSPVEDGHTVSINENESCTSPVEKAKPVIIVDENQTKKNHRSPVEKAKYIEENKLKCDVINRGDKDKSNNQSIKCIKREVEAAEKRIREKKEKIASLKLAKLYRKKHDTQTLSTLTEKWREGCQLALQELLRCSSEHGCQMNMTQLITQLGIPFHLVRYNPDSEDFE